MDALNVSADVIADFISHGLSNKAHTMENIDSMLGDCDALSLIMFEDRQSGLDFLSFAHLSLYQLPSTLDKKYEEGLFEILRKMDVFKTMGVVDDVLVVIAGYMKPYTFSLRFDEIPRSSWNENYFCNILRVTLSRNHVLVEIDEHGDGSAGSLQLPYSSKIQYPEHLHIKPTHTSFSHFDIGRRISGIMTFEFENLCRLKLTDILSLCFEYGVNGYDSVRLFDSKNDDHRAFIEDFLQYHE